MPSLALSWALFKDERKLELPDSRVPDLTFPEVRFGVIETQWSLCPLLYRGGAGTNVRRVSDQIEKGELGAPIQGRVPLVERLHEYLAGRIASGISRATIALSISQLRGFYTWVDKTGRSATLHSVEHEYIEYSEHLLNRVRVLKNIGESSAYGYALGLAGMLDDVLQLKFGLLARTRLTTGKIGKRVLGTEADKQNLEQTFAFGRFLLDITDALTIESIRGPMPLTIRLRSGQTLEEWCRLKPAESLKTMHVPQWRRVALRRRAAWEADTSIGTRHSLINLRMEAELLIFIAQTGMNLAQAVALTIGKFRYQSYLDGYRVYRVYKGRRSGEVEFEIYSEYRALFERYLSWRTVIFPAGDDDRVFPFVPLRGAIRTVQTFQAVQRRCKRIGLPCILPRKLRNTRINWLQRRSRDPQLTAEMNQHSQETLFRNYDQPHHQVAAFEISRFLHATDPAIAMPGPGICIGNAPSPESDSQSPSPTSDCISPAGCLFCNHHRDIDTDDHVWSLATYRHFKSVELALYKPSATDAAVHPAAVVIDRVTSKLKHFHASSEIRALWVREALARIDEGHYHPKWDGFIQLVELRK
jgi:integrase